ncbi:hypothetical protein [Shewanella woodyi]|uniref:hypothetical protein n=1 Tax=Shewanella woodyi TaxID=60961 RepID=UPI00374951B1
MKNKDSIDVLVAQLYAFKVAYSWEHKGWGGKYDHLALWGLSIFASYALFGFFGLSSMILA